MILDMDTKILTHEDRSAQLRPYGAAILQILARGYPRAVSYARAADLLWGPDEPSSDVFKVHIFNLRNAIKRASIPLTIRNIWGGAYILNDPVEIASEIDPIHLPFGIAVDVAKILRAHPDQTVTDRLLVYFGAAA